MPTYTNAKLFKKGPGRPRKGYTKTGKKLGRPSSKPTVSQVKRIVKTVFNKNCETKTREVYNLSRDLYSSNSGPFASSNLIQVSFGASAVDVSQGVADGQRIGNKIKLKRLYFKGTFIPVLYNAANNPTPKPVQIKMVFFYTRAEPADFPTNPQLDFLQFGSTTTALTNDLVDMWAPFNTDKYRILATRTYKLGQSTYAVSGTTPAVPYSNNDFQLNCNFKVNLTKHLPKLIRYNDNNMDPTSRGIWCLIIPVWADGQQAPNTTLMANMSYVISGFYTDD